MVSPFVLTLSLCLLVAIAPHLVMSFGQTLIHYKVAHRPIGGKIFRNHINFHNTLPAIVNNLRIRQGRVRRDPDRILRIRNNRGIRDTLRSHRAFAYH